MIDIKVSDITLDKEQMRALTSDSKATLVIAGAGCGKTTTIVGRIKYLLENKNISQEEILVISFTNASVDDLKNKLIKNGIKNIDVLTFHKLSIKILKESGEDFNIVDNYLEFVLDEYFASLIYNDIEAMYCVLKYYDITTLKFNVLKKYKNLLKNCDISFLKKSLVRFIKTLKTNGYDILKFKTFYKRKFKTRSFYYLKLALLIYQIYEYELKSNNLYDFEKLIIDSIEKLDFVNLNYKALIIDEYQDTSPVKFKLVKKIVDKTGASFFAVGDDFQSIYRFAGCDLNIMLDFKTYFPGGEIFFITKTYRNSKQLLDIEGKFIMKNKSQIKKELKSDKELLNPVKFVYYKNPKQALSNILKLNSDKEILILGRNNNDILKYAATLPKNAKYLTVHKSKGLESDVTILINMYDSVLGFPSKLIEDKMLKLVLPISDRYPYSEERRLFYVALTRTKSYVYIMVPTIKKSIFVKELEKIVKRSKVV